MMEQERKKRSSVERDKKMTFCSTQFLRRNENKLDIVLRRTSFRYGNQSHIYTYLKHRI